MPGKSEAATFYYMFMHGSSRCGEVNDINYDSEGAREGQYGCTRGLIWVHMSGPLWVWNH